MKETNMKNRFVKLTGSAEVKLQGTPHVPSHKPPQAHIPSLTAQRQRIPITAPAEAEQVPSASKPFSLENKDGFWELTFAGHKATLTQNPALFYVAWLLANPPAEPISPTDLSAAVYVLFESHPDFIRDLDWVLRHHTEAEATRLLEIKKTQLEAILDNPNEPAEVKNEALQESVIVYQLQEAYARESLKTNQRLTRNINASFRKLLNDLASAEDFYGRPQQILRAFGRHLLLYIFLPTMRAGGNYTYEKPAGIIWQPIS
jgi:hypothetical protein